MAEMAGFLERFTVSLASRTLCRTWAEVSDQARRNGRPIQVADAWVAATAVMLGVPLATHNLADYSGVPNLRILAADQALTSEAAN
jgi:predicted nucleic acid-binding protein